MKSLTALYNRHSGQPAVILGGAPSLITDLIAIGTLQKVGEPDRPFPENPVLIAANHHAYCLGIPTHYTICLDPPAIDPAEHRRTGGALITPDLTVTDYDLRGVPQWGRFSGQRAAWLACYMDCDPIILCGFDLYRSAPPPGQEKNNAYKDPLERHLKEWRAIFKHTQRADQIRAVSGPLTELFGKYQP